MSGPNLATRLQALSPPLRIGSLLGLLFAGGGLWFGLLALILVCSGVNPLQGVSFEIQTLYVVVLYLYLLGLTLWFWTKVEADSLQTMGMRFSPPNLLVGLLLGVGMVVLLRFIEGALGLVVFKAPLLSWLMLTSLLSAVLVSVFEELVFRGVILQTLLKTGKPWKAVLGSSGIWAALHFLRPLAPIDLLSFVGLILSGVLLGLAYLRVRSLWLPIGIHAGWVYVIALAGQTSAFSFKPEMLLLHGNGSPNTGVLGISLIFLIAYCLWRYLPRLPSPSIPRSPQKSGKKQSVL